MGRLRFKSRDQSYVKPLSGETKSSRFDYGDVITPPFKPAAVVVNSEPRNGGAENRTRVQRPTPENSTCLAASPLPVSLRRVRRRRVSEASKTPPTSSPVFSRPLSLSTKSRPAQLSDASLRFA